jgi:hypothetical protein
MLTEEGQHYSERVVHLSALYGERSLLLLGTVPMDLHLDMLELSMLPPVTTCNCLLTRQGTNSLQPHHEEYP